MPDYYTLIGDMVPPPPFEHRNVTVHGMFFEADLQALQGYMDNSFNLIEGIRCEVQIASVMLVTLYAGDVRPADPRYDRRDGISEIDSGFWALVRCGREGEPSRLYWTPLCLFVNSVFALVIGRELYGFPKMLGTMHPATPPAEADLRIDVRTSHFLRQGTREVMVPDAPLFQVVRDTSPERPAELIDLDDLKRLAGQYLESLMPSAVLDAFEGQSLGIPYLDMPMVFLRQLRAVHGTPSAAYSSVVAATMVPDTMPSIERIDDDSLELVLSPSCNLPLDKLIGLKSGQKASLPFRAMLDFTAGEGEEI